MRYRNSSATFKGYCNTSQFKVRGIVIPGQVIEGRNCTFFSNIKENAITALSLSPRDYCSVIGNQLGEVKLWKLGEPFSIIRGPCLSDNQPISSLGFLHDGGFRIMCTTGSQV